MLRAVLARPLTLAATPATTASTRAVVRTASSTTRPISPHLDIYKLDLKAYVSVSTRITGMALCGGLYTAGAIAAFGGDVPCIVDAFKSNGLVLFGTKALVAFPFAFHYLAALRHFYWDANPAVLTNSHVAQSSKVLLGAAIALTLIASVVSLKEKDGP